MEFGTGEVQLFNIYDNGVWYGSRRTKRQCEVFMTDRIEEEETVKLPLHDTHVRMWNTLRTFGEKWWFQIWEEIEGRESSEKG